ncbi:MAG TPA: metallophosphoesterase [Gemmatimonadaceae bacterium]|nr:metallophosphoesterase [Gemmatimonadaceae bacterium]
MTEPASPSRRRLLRGAAAATALAATGGALVVSGNRLDVHRVPTPDSPRSDGSREPLRVALLTDVHAPHDWFAFDELAAATRAFDPHVVLVVGDAINRRGDEQLVRAYGALPARLAKLAVLGNWEYQGRCDVAALRAEYDSAGVRLLVNESATIDHGGELVAILGLDDYLRGRPRLSLLTGLASSASASAPRTLVMAHCPALFDTARQLVKAPFVALSGHTHGGQIAPFGRALVTPPGSGAYVKGWYGDASQRLYVSRGLGNSDIPFRVGSPPELALLTL